MKKIIIVFLFLAIGAKAQLPTSDISTSDIRTALGLTGETTFQAMCTSGNVYSAGLNNTYCSGADAAARLANLQSTPYDIGKFRGYTHVNPCSMSLNVTSRYICDYDGVAYVRLTASGVWACVRTGSTNISIDNMSGYGTTDLTITYSGASCITYFTFSSSGCSDVVLTVEGADDCE